MTPAALEEAALRADARRNLSRILEAAQEVFAENGLSAGVAEVARRAGVGNATIFRRFPQKEDLAVAVVERLLRQRIEELRSLPSGLSPVEALGDFLERMVDWQVRDRALLESMPAGLLADPRLVPLRDELSGIAAGHLAEAQRRGQVRPGVTAEDLAVLCQALGQVGSSLADSDPGAWRRYLAIVVSGLRHTDQPLPGAPPGWDAICAGKERHGRGYPCPSGP